MPDLQKILSSAEGTIDSVVLTSGCTVTLRRPRDPAGDHVDPATLAVTDSVQTPYATGVAALFAPAGGASDDLPARPAVHPGGRVILRDQDAGQVQRRDEVVIATARDQWLVGVEFAVTKVTRLAVGIVTILEVGPVERP